MPAEGIVLDRTSILHFLGCGAAFNPSLGSTAAYVREGDRLLLLDCGESVFERLLRGHVLDGVRELNIALSHLHSDHCGSLGSTVLYARFSLHAEVRLLMPPGEETYAASVRTLLGFYGVPEDAWRMMVPAGLKPFQAVRSLRYVRTDHDPRMICFSFELETPAGGIFYSADTRTTAQMEAFIASHSRIAAIYMEMAETDTPGSIHLPLARLQAALPKELRGKTFLMHLASSRCEDLAREAGFSVVRAEQDS